MRGKPALSPHPPDRSAPRDRYGIPTNIFYGVTDEAEIKKLAEAWKPAEQETGAARCVVVVDERGKSEREKSDGKAKGKGKGKKGGKVKGAKVKKDYGRSERVLRSNKGGKLVDGLP